MAIADIFNTPKNEVEARMRAYIKQHFSEVLGPHTALVDEANGLEVLAELMQKGAIGDLQ